ncbi:MAG: acyl carrier protein [Terriglobales bacterium]|jgi:acyl carrier protein
MLRLDQRELMRIFAEVLEVDPSKLSEQSSPDNVQGWDSAKSMEIVITIEEALNLEFSADELAGMSSIGATKAMLMQKGVVIQ